MKGFKSKSDLQIQSAPIKRWLRPLGVFCLLASASCHAQADSPLIDAEVSDELPSYLQGPQYLQGPDVSVASLIQGTADGDKDASTDNLGLPGEGVTDDRSADFSAIEAVGADIDDVANRSLFSDRQTELVAGKLRLPPIAALTTGTKEIGNGEVPLGFRNGAVSPVIGLPESGAERGLPWEWNSSVWAAANTFSHPLYFEDRMLERHGHQLCPHFQPALAGGRFIAQAAMLPYLVTIAPPCECQYTLGYYRAGSCAPKLKQRPPYKRKAAAAQATAIAGAILVLP